MSDYPPNYTPNDPPDDLDVEMVESWKSPEFRSAWARNIWELPGASVYLCCACGLTVDPDADGKRRFEGVTAAGAKRWVWGPYPCHDACRVDVKTPFDDDPSAVPAWERL